MPPAVSPAVLPAVPPRGESMVCKPRRLVVRAAVPPAVPLVVSPVVPPRGELMFCKPRRSVAQQPCSQSCFQLCLCVASLWISSLVGFLAFVCFVHSLLYSQCRSILVVSMIVIVMIMMRSLADGSHRLRPHRVLSDAIGDAITEKFLHHEVHNRPAGPAVYAGPS